MLNPDLRESLYNARIAQEETKRVLLRMFPGLSFNYSLNKSNDSYLITTIGAKPACRSRSTC